MDRTEDMLRELFTVPLPATLSARVRAALRAHDPSAARPARNAIHRVSVHVA